MNKCEDCKYYMEREYQNGGKGITRYCLKLKDTISTTIKIISCNQYKQIKRKI